MRTISEAAFGDCIVEDPGCEYSDKNQELHKQKECLTEVYHSERNGLWIFSFRSAQ